MTVGEMTAFKRCNFVTVGTKFLSLINTPIVWFDILAKGKIDYYCRIKSSLIWGGGVVLFLSLFFKKL